VASGTLALLGFTHRHEGEPAAPLRARCGPIGRPSRPSVSTGERRFFEGAAAAGFRTATQWREGEGAVPRWATVEIERAAGGAAWSRLPRGGEEEERTRT